VTCGKDGSRAARSPSCRSSELVHGCLYVLVVLTSSVVQGQEYGVDVPENTHVKVNDGL
jgi:hypothetical protein